jgi:4-diphosphocytidyl-2-C-methyl-D-erythritol kinase
VKRARSVSVRRVVVEARAKLNLGLIVGPPRDDGFHEIATLFQSISLADTLEIRPRARGFSLSVRLEDASIGPRGRGTRSGRSSRTPDGPSVTRGKRKGGSSAHVVPRGADNLVLRAARLWRETTGIESGAAFRLIKRIPAGAGMGGGSADAAATLAGLSALHRVRLGRARSLELAARLGSDVPFALVGGTALGLGRGQRLTPVKLARPFRALIAVPQWRVSTAAAFADIDRHKNLLTPWRVKLRSAQLLGRKRLRAEAWMRLGNTFEEVLGIRRVDFLSLEGRLRRAGATDVRMTGSGSAVFGMIEPGIPSRRVVECFEGSEAIFVVRSRMAGLRAKTATVA